MCPTAALTSKVSQSSFTNLWELWQGLACMHLQRIDMTSLRFCSPCTSFSPGQPSSETYQELNSENIVQRNQVETLQRCWYLLAKMFTSVAWFSLKNKIKSFLQKTSLFMTYPQALRIVALTSSKWVKPRWIVVKSMKWGGLKSLNFKEIYNGYFWFIRQKSKLLKTISNFC